MNKLIEGKLLQVENDWHEIFAHLDACDPALRNKQPQANAWSHLDVAHHLLLVEGGVAGILESSLQKLDTLPVIGFQRAIVSVALKAVLRSSIRVPAPIPQIVPDGSMQFEELKEAYTVASTALRQAVEQFPESHYNRAVFRHPLAGWFNLSQTLSFLHDHYLHHRAQFRRIEAALGRSSAG